MLTQRGWTDRLALLKADSAPLEDTVTLYIVDGYLVWRARIVTVISTVKTQQDKATLAKYHAGEVMHDIRRGMNSGSLIGATNTVYGQSYWGVQMSTNKSES